jgi:hypothetical protein
MLAMSNPVSRHRMIEEAFIGDRTPRKPEAEKRAEAPDLIR